jgi:8-oxo-dGTP diphosphatase
MKIGVDYIGVSAGAVIVDGEGRYFLAKRGNGARDDVGTWEFPGGSVEFYETREAAVHRNILEKHGVKVTIEHVLGVYDVIDRLRKDHWVSTTYLCTLVPGGIPKILFPDKCSDIGWFSLAEVRQLELSRITQLNLADILGADYATKPRAQDI